MADTFVEVKVEEGILRGKQITTQGYTDVKYYAFFGVPFAKPPVGELRFKAPQPAEPWEGVRDALNTTPSAPQSRHAILPGPAVGNEDCLYLDVFTTEIPNPQTKLKPVLFNIHGGGFSGGSRDFCNPDYMIDEGIVFVSTSYRLGALGFLSLQNDEISGNAGMKDQVQALQWVRKNIKQFGGDPDNVTIIGLSAGAASVDYLVLSEMSKGLFKQAVILSGSALNPWAFNSSPREMAVRLAKKLGYTGDIKDDAELAKFLKSCPFQDIAAQQDVFGDDTLMVYAVNFAPCVEKEGKGPKFITQTPRQIFESGSFNKVPIMIGQASSEGYLYCFLSPDANKGLEKLNNKWELVVPKDIAVPQDKVDNMVQEVRKFYFDSKPVTKDNIYPLTVLVGDVAFGNGIETAMRSYIQGSSQPVYCYTYSYASDTGFTKKMIKATYPDSEIIGVPHGGDADALYKMRPNALNEVLDVKLDGAEPSETDIKYSKLYTKMITTFAKTGNPNYPGLDFVWEPATKNAPKYLDIGRPVKMIAGKHHEKGLKFWEAQYNKYGYMF